MRLAFRGPLLEVEPHGSITGSNESPDEIPAKNLLRHPADARDISIAEDFAFSGKKSIYRLTVGAQELVM